MMVAIIAIGITLLIENPSRASSFCEPTDLKIRSMPSNPLGPEGYKLLNESEKGIPGVTERLMAQPGLYGHSEFGFRYLSRLMGFTGEFVNPKVTEFIILSRAIKDPSFKGTDLLWKEYVQEPKLFLNPFSLSDAGKDPGNPDLLFDQPLDRVEFEHCVSMAYFRSRCEAQIGQPLFPGAWVRFNLAEGTSRQRLGKPELSFKCAVAHNYPRELWIGVNNALGRGEVKNMDGLLIQGSNPNLKNGSGESGKLNPAN
jgi:hypothetical protein